MTARVLPHDVSGTGSIRVVVLHGWFGDRTSFDAIRGHLDTEHFSYGFVDFRGYGEAREHDGDHTVSEAAADVLATADALGWERFNLLGHSMGGMVAQHVLSRAADRVQSIVGISPVPASGVPFDDQSWALFSGAEEDVSNRRAIIDFTTGNRLPGPWLDAMVHRSVSRSDKTAFRRFLNSWAKTDISERVRDSQVRVLVIAGAQDPALSPQVMESTWLQWYPNSELTVFADAGHYAQDEVPLALVAEVERFLAP